MQWVDLKLIYPQKSLPSSYNTGAFRKNSAFTIKAKEFRRQPGWHSKLPGQMHKTTAPGNEIFSTTNIFKGCKITYFTRPIEFGTTMNKVATRNLVEFGSRNDYVPQGH